MVSGLITQFIGAAYFVMYRKSINQLNYFYSQLTRNQDTMVSVKLADTLSDENKRNLVKEYIIKELLATSQKRSATLLDNLGSEDFISTGAPSSFATK
jgi:hypothetical protein